MKINAKITMCDVQTGTSVTGQEWKKANYIAIYDGTYSNGSPCVRSIAFEVFGQKRLNDLRILKDQKGVLEFETKTDSRQGKNGTYYVNVIDILSWTLEGANEAAKDNAQSVAPSAPAPDPNQSESASDALPF